MQIANTRLSERRVSREKVEVNPVSLPPALSLTRDGWYMKRESKDLAAGLSSIDPAWTTDSPVPIGRLASQDDTPVGNSHFCSPQSATRTVEGGTQVSPSKVDVVCSLSSIHSQTTISSIWHSLLDADLWAHTCTKQSLKAITSGRTARQRLKGFQGRVS